MKRVANKFLIRTGLSRVNVALFVLAFSVIGVAWLLHSRAGTSGLPAGVTLQQIDGGSNYYCSNGFTYACSSTFNGMSWDDPKFFPIGDDYPFYAGNSTTTFKDLGLNFAHRVTGDVDLTTLKNAGIWAWPATGEGKNPGPETVGWHIEEPDGWSGVVSQVNETPAANLLGRFLQISSTWNQFVYGGYDSPCGSSMPQAMSCPISTATGSAHLNIPGDDIYWFAGSTVPDPYGARYAGSLFYNNGGTGTACGDAGSGIKCTTADQMARGSNYGDMVDQMRGWTAPPAQAAPNCPYIETEDGLVGTGSREITPPELSWAVWSTIVHGARCILYFGTTSNFGSVPNFGFSKSVLSGQTISMNDQAKATNTLVKNLAPVINSPFALHYVSATPAAYTFPTEHLTLDSGVDIMAKYYSGGSYTNSTGTMGNGFYVFGSVRGSETQTNVRATFTTADGYTGPVTVVGENRTVPATNGVFSDTFVKATDTHIYQIPYNASASGLVGDINNDGAVNIFDLSVLLSKWNGTDAASDLNHDGAVNVFDLSVLLSHWGQTGATPTPILDPTPSSSVCAGAANTPGGSDGKGGCWPGAATTGYKAAPDYPGSLHTCTGPIQSNTTYNFCDFVGGADVGTLSTAVSNVTFHGCRFKGTGGDGALVFLFGSNITFDYDSFEPVSSAPPVSFANSYQFALEGAGGYNTHITKLTVSHSDFWGWGNAIDVDGSTQANPQVFRDNWIHDSANDGGGQYHVDGIGSEGTGGSSASMAYAVIDHNSIYSAGNTNGLAFQRNGNYNNFSITNNLFGGFGYTVSIDPGTGTANNNVFMGNVFSTGLAVGFGPLYPSSVAWWTGHGGSWRGNKWAVPAGAPWGVAAHNGWYWLPVPGDNHGATDDSQFVSQTDYTQ